METFFRSVTDDPANPAGPGASWELNDNQLKQLITYLQANQLLLDCLKVAYVTNRAEVEAGLLLPPERKEG